MAKPFKIKKVSPADPAHRAAVRILRTRLREFYSHWPDTEEIPSPEQLHNQRISGKRLRYSAETLREFYPDRLALLIDLLKRQQDLLGEIQDAVTQRSVIALDLARRRLARARREEITGLEALLATYDSRHSELFTGLEDIWRGMTSKRFRALLKDLVSRPVRQTDKEPQAPQEITQEVVSG
jgi:CHAD domain-containing protein